MRVQLKFNSAYFSSIRILTTANLRLQELFKTSSTEWHSVLCGSDLLQTVKRVIAHIFWQIGSTRLGLTRLQSIQYCSNYSKRQVLNVAQTYHKLLHLSLHIPPHFTYCMLLWVRQSPCPVFAHVNVHANISLTLHSIHKIPWLFPDFSLLPLIPWLFPVFPVFPVAENPVI